LRFGGKTWHDRYWHECEIAITAIFDQSKPLKILNSSTYRHRNHWEEEV